MPMVLHSPSIPKTRIILLGASNLTLSLRLVIHLMQQQFGGPSEILTAVGHGRAYGVASQMLLRGLPGIADCGLWRQLDLMESCTTVALLTDIGNDILYELAPQQILKAVEWCVNQLHKQSAQILMTNLPMTSIENLSERRYRFFRNLFYPFCQLSRQETVCRARMVHRGLIDLSLRLQFKLIEPESIWFGPDGIHVSYRRRKAFYQHLVAQFELPGDGQKIAETESSLWLTWQRRPQFAYKTVMSSKIFCAQPSGWLDNGSSIYKY